MPEITDVKIQNPVDQKGKLVTTSWMAQYNRFGCAKRRIDIFSCYKSVTQAEHREQTKNDK